MDHEWIFCFIWFSFAVYDGFLAAEVEITLMDIKKKEYVFLLDFIKNND